MNARRAVAVVFVVALLPAACGSSTLDGTKLGPEIEEKLRRQLPQRPIEVKCPKTVEIKAMSTFDCPTTVGRDKGVVKVTQQDDMGNVRFQYQPSSK